MHSRAIKDSLHQSYVLLVDLIESVLIPVVVSIAGGFGGATLRDYVKRKSDEKHAPDFIVRLGKEEVRFVYIQNVGPKSLPECLVWHEHFPCAWRDGSVGKKSIAPGGGANANLPENANADSFIKIRSKNTTVFKKRLAEIENG
jgi:hypothetical protein